MDVTELKRRLATFAVTLPERANYALTCNSVAIARGTPNTESQIVIRVDEPLCARLLELYDDTTAEEDQHADHCLKVDGITVLSGLDINHISYINGLPCEVLPTEIMGAPHMTPVIKDGINYGRLVKVIIDDVAIVGEHGYFKYYLFNNKAFEYLPYENHYCQLTIELETHMQPYFYAERQEDVMKVAAKLSEGHAVRICGMSRILARFSEGKLIDGPYSVEEFYIDLKAEDIESHRLI